MNPEKMQIVSQVVILVGAVLAALGAYGNSRFGKEADRLKIEKNQAEQAQLRSKIDDLVSGSQKLQGQLSPFVELAKQRFPGLATDEALDKVRDTLRSLEQKTATIGEKLKPRKLSDSQVSDLTEALRKVTPAKIRILRPSGDSEAATLTEHLKKAFERAGWIIEQDLLDLTGTPRFGIIAYGSVDPPNAQLVAFYRALQSSGLSITLTRDVSLPRDVIGLQVGSKPEQ